MRTLVVLAAVLFLALPAVAADQDVFTLSMEEFSFDAASISWGIANVTSSTGGGGGSGKVQLRDLTITKTVDKASPNLFKHCAGGKHFDKAVLTAKKKGGKSDYLVITIKDVQITSYSLNNSNSSAPTETISLSYQSVDYQVSSRD